MVEFQDLLEGESFMWLLVGVASEQFLDVKGKLLESERGYTVSALVDPVYFSPLLTSRVSALDKWDIIILEAGFLLQLLELYPDILEGYDAVEIGGKVFSKPPILIVHSNEDSKSLLESKVKGLKMVGRTVHYPFTYLDLQIAIESLNRYWVPQKPVKVS